MRMGESSYLEQTEGVVCLMLVLCAQAWRASPAMTRTTSTTSSHVTWLAAACLCQLSPSLRWANPCIAPEQPSKPRIDQGITVRQTLMMAHCGSWLIFCWLGVSLESGISSLRRLHGSMFAFMMHDP